MDSDSVQITVLVVSIIISLTLHELMHALVSDRLGDDTARLSGRLSLNPLKHLDPITTVLIPIMLYLSGLPPFGAAKPVPVNPYRLKGGDYGHALVAAAGPLTNFILAVISGFIIRANFFGAGSFMAEVISLFALVNVSFFVFNMIPFPPLDGSRVLYSVAPEPLQKVMDSIERMGIMAIFVFIVIVFPFIRPIMLDVNSYIIRMFVITG